MLDFLLGALALFLMACAFITFVMCALIKSGNTRRREQRQADIEEAIRKSRR